MDLTTIWAETSIVVDLWLILSLCWFVWYVAQKTSKLEEKIAQHDKTIAQIEWLKLETILTQIRADMEWMKATITEVRQTQKEQMKSK